jgi:hypothetical protein
VLNRELRSDLNQQQTIDRRVRGEAATTSALPFVISTGSVVTPPEVERRVEIR